MLALTRARNCATELVSTHQMLAEGLVPRFARGIGTYQPRASRRISPRRPGLRAQQAVPADRMCVMVRTGLGLASMPGAEPVSCMHQASRAITNNE